MSRKVPGKSFSYDKEAEEKETQRKDPPGFVPWSNPNEVLATNRRNPTQGPSKSGHQRVVSSARRHHQQDARPRAEALSRPIRHPPVFVEETRPGAIFVPGINDDGLPIEERYDEQATVASNEASTVHVVATAVDTEEERRIRHQRDQFQHERDQLRHILDNAAVVTPIVTTNRDEENGDENIHADNQDGLPRSDDPECGTRGRRWFAIGAILVIVAAVAVTLAMVLTPPTTPPPDPLDELLSSISSESLTGTIPTEIGMLSDNLTSILLYDNGLTGTIPSEIGQLTKLTSLHLTYNTLTGTIPTEIGMLSDSLTDIDLYGNGLTGTIPSEIGRLTELTSLSLWDNKLTGTIPTEIGMLSDSLKELSLSLNELEGTIPSEVWQLTKLTWQDLSDNALTGTVPSEMNTLVNLVELYLYGNNFTGNFTCPEPIKKCGISCDPWSDDWSYTDVCRSL